MTPETLLKTAIVPALGLIDRRLDSPAARAMLVCIALQESGLTARRQILDAGREWWESRPGPAHGLWQFERMGGVYGVVTRNASAREIVTPAIRKLLYPHDVDIVYEAITHNDILACVLARALLWTVPHPLPDRMNSDVGWGQYLGAWRPGKPHKATWADNYRRAWEAVDAA